jgi:outer membrane protein assembly factor BamD
MNSSTRNVLLRAAALALLASTTAACAGGANKAREERQFVDQPVEQLYNQGADMLDKRRYTEASAAFDEVERQHPYSSWARRAMLMNAYAKYQANSYADAIEAARRFISLHPGNESAPYAYYLVAVCYFEQILDVGRDQKNTEAALQALNEVMQRFPNSEYAKDARLKADMTYDQLAGKEMEVGRFYEVHDQHVAAIARFKNVIDNQYYQRTTHTPEALHRLVECYLSVGMVEEAQKAAAVLGYNFPGSEWYQRTYALMNAKGVSLATEAEAQRRGWLGRTFGRGFGRTTADAKTPAPPPPAEKPGAPTGS